MCNVSLNGTQPSDASLRVLRALEAAGLEAWYVGGWVRDALMGYPSHDVDMCCSGLWQESKAALEAAGIAVVESGIKFGGITAISDGERIEVTTYRLDGFYTDGRHPQSVERAASLEDDLARRDFTINAIAESQDSLMDPYDGRADIKNKLIRTVGDAGARFREDPLRMIKALRLAAELDFDLHKSVYDAIVSGHTMLSEVNPSKIRDEFTGMLSAPAAGKGLSMLLGTGMIADIIGQNAVDRLTKREMQDLTTLSQNIDKTQPVEDRRLGLFFACIDKKKIRPAIDRLNFDEVTHQHLVDAVNDLPKLYFTNNKPALKKFIYQRSMERYEFLLSMEKAQRIVFSYDSETKIRSKIFMLDEIHKFGEPIFPEDLKIDANDLIEAGICDRDKAQKILNMLTEEIHTHPKKNTREQLLKLAKVYSKNKVAAALRGIHWTR